MVTEFAKIQAKARHGSEVGSGGRERAADLPTRAKGCHGISLQRSAEGRFALLAAGIKWDSVEAHTRAFMGSPDFAEFVGLIAECLAGRPEVDHVTETWTGF